MRANFTVGSIVHVLNRGAKKLPIYRQKGDLWRILFNLFYLNNQSVPDNWARELEKQGILANLQWPSDWGQKKPLVSILAFTIMPNHFHFVLKEIKDRGIKEFMHKFTMAYSKFINAKYDESGSLFQGPYKSQTVQTDEYLRYLAVYIMVKNTFELYPNGGLQGAIQDFNKAYEWAIEYPFTSLGDYAGTRHSSIIQKDILGEIFISPAEFKEFAKDCLLGRRSDIPDFFD
jgi:putative transposase